MGDESERLETEAWSHEAKLWIDSKEVKMKDRIYMFEIEKVHKKYIETQVRPHINLLTIEMLIWILKELGFKVIQDSFSHSKE